MFDIVHESRKIDEQYWLYISLIIYLGMEDQQISKYLIAQLLQFLHIVNIIYFFWLKLEVYQTHENFVAIFSYLENGHIETTGSKTHRLLINYPHYL